MVVASARTRAVKKQIDELAQLDTGADEPGIAPASPASAPAAGAGGQIVTLPAPSAPAPTAATSSEAILALPKDAPRDFELGPGARIVESYWSPVLCATVARVSGPAGATPNQLVLGAPETAALVPNHVYASAASDGEV